LHTFRDKTLARRAGELFLCGGGAARVFLAFGHEALERRSGELLFGGLGGAIVRFLRMGAADGERCEERDEDSSHECLLEFPGCASSRPPRDGSAPVMRDQKRKEPFTTPKTASRQILDAGDRRQRSKCDPWTATQTGSRAAKAYDAEKTNRLSG